MRENKKENRKSLKHFISKSSIEKEVNKWSFDECWNYFNKEKKRRVDEKVKIVLEKGKKLIDSSSFEKKEFKKYLFESKINTAYQGALETHLDKKLDGIVKKELKKLVEDRNLLSAKYLYVSGYKIKNFLGKGGSGDVWECESKDGSSKAVKVMIGKNDKVVAEELESAKRIKQILRKNKKAEKYLMKIKQKNNDILESEVAKEDLKKSIDKKKNKKKIGKTIDSILRKAKQAIKAVKFLHDAGYSHNDIKPENFLKVANNYSGAIQKAKSAEKKQHKNRIKLADFGSMTRFDDEEWGVGTQIYEPPERAATNLKSIDKSKRKEIVEKRDVFSLGVTFIELLKTSIDWIDKFPWKIREKVENTIEELSKSSEEFYDKYKEDLEGTFGGTSRKNMIKFLELIEKMTRLDYKKRISIDEALKEIRNLKGGK